jgi:glycosyltransferase involved in cell wall biosynthesis
VGFQKNIPEWLAMADISVLPSFFEGLPLTAIESSAAGRPVIGTAVDGTPEVVLDGRTGILVPPGDAGALARAIRELSCDPALRHAMGEAGSQWVFQHFSEDRFIRQSEDLYLQLWAASTKRALATRAVNATRGRR